MAEVEYSRASDASTLCKACGLCCTGHLFSWVRLKATELIPLEKLGLNVIRSDPRQRGFTQPCPMWNGQCSIYDSPHYPRGCDSYKCKLLRELLDESVSLPSALRVVKRAKAMVQDMEPLLTVSSERDFRERFIAQIEHEKENIEFQKKAENLLLYYREHFGVTDLIESTGDVTE